MIRAVFVMLDLAGGGAELSLIELLSSLDRALIAPELFLIRRRGTHLAKVPEDLPVTFGSTGSGHLRTHLPVILARAMRQCKGADVVIGAMEGFPAYLASLVAALLRKPLVGWVQTDLDLHLRLVPAWHRRASAAAFGRCDSVVALSPGSASSLRRVLPEASGSIRIIPNSVDLNRVRRYAQQDLPPDLRQLGCKPFVIAIGRLSNAQKGFDLLLRAHALARGRGLDHNLLILGEGPDQSLLEDLARSLHVENSVIMPGFLENPFSILRRAAALIAPSRVEGFGRVILEALALGVPVIASPASGPLEVLDHGKYGIVVDCSDVSALADAIARVVTDRETRTRLSELAVLRSRHYEAICPAREWENLLLGVTKSR